MLKCLRAWLNTSLNPVLPPSAADLRDVCALIVLSVCCANLIGLLGCYTCSVVNGKHTARQGDVLRRKQMPTDGFNIQQMNSQIFHTSTPDGPNEIEMQTRQTPHALWFDKGYSLHWTKHRCGRHAEVREEGPTIIESFQIKPWTLSCQACLGVKRVSPFNYSANSAHPASNQAASNTFTQSICYHTSAQIMNWTWVITCQTVMNQ